MRNLTIAGALAALILAPLPAMAQAGSGMTVVAGSSCPVTPTVAVGNNRPLIGLTTGTLCTSGSGGGGTTPAAVPSTGGNLTITTGGTYQLLLASNTARIGCTIRNPATATEPMSVRIGLTGAVFDLPIGTNFGCGVSGVPVSISDAIYVTAPTTGHAFEENFQ